MKFSFLNKYLNYHIKPKNKRPFHPKQPKLSSGLQVEFLENRLLLTVLEDFADTIITEVEPNDVSPGQEVTFDIENYVYAVGLDANLSDGEDVDIFSFDVDPNGKLELMAEIAGGGDQELTSLAANTVEVDGEYVAYVISGNSVWRQNPSDSDTIVDLWASQDDLAEAAGLTAGEVILTDLAVNPEGKVLVTLSGRGDILSINTNKNISQILETDDIIALTGQSVDLVSIAVDGDGIIYAADDHSGSILQITEGSGNSYSVAYYASGEDMVAGLRDEVFADIYAQRASIPTTVIAQWEGETDFVANDLVWGSGVYGVTGYDGYYVPNLGWIETPTVPREAGDGTITRILINQDDPEDVIFEKFFDPETSQVTSGETLDPLFLNPSALALDSSGAFGNQLFLGTFGSTLGDNRDGRIFAVDEDGNLSEFVTSYVDQEGDPIEDGGFFDITAMAFSQGWGFDNGSEPYLYVLDENDSTTSLGDFGSNIWRVDSEGVAELFIEDITDRVISLAFSDFLYGGDLFVSTYNGGEILRVENDGSTSMFYRFGSSYSVSDLVFASADSIMEGELVFTFQGPDSNYLAQLGPSTTSSHPDIQIWMSGLVTGDVSSGDLVFTPSGDLIMASGGDEDLIQIDEQDVLDFTFIDLQVRPVVYEREIPGTEPPEYEDATVYVPYMFLESIEQPRIVSLGQSGQSDDIVTEVTAATLGLTTADADNLNIAFTFDDDGDIYIYVQKSDVLLMSFRTEEETPTQENPYVAGVFDDFSSRVSGADIAAGTDLIDPQITRLAFAPDGSFFCLGSNGTEPEEEGGDPPSQEFDDALLFLGTELAITWAPRKLLGVDNLTRLQVSLSGPGISDIFEVAPDAVSRHSWEDLQGGTYLVSMSSLVTTDTQINYSLVISLGEETTPTIIITEDTGTWTLTNTDDEQLRITYTGMGQVAVEVNQRPNGKIIDIPSLSITGSYLTSELNIVMMNADAQWMLDEVLLGGSLGKLSFAGTIDTLRAESTTFGIVKEAQLGEVHNVDAPLCSFWDFQAESLGQAEQADQVFNALSLRNLDVVEDIANVQFFESGSTNVYRNITVGGVIEGSTFYGGLIDTLLVENHIERTDPENPNMTVLDVEDTAINDSAFVLSETAGSLRQILVQEGDVINSAFYVGKRLDKFEIVNGNFEGSILYATAYISRIGEVIISREEGTADEDAGNVTGSQVRATGWLSKLRADGAVSSDSQIVATGTLVSRIGTISTGGDFAGVISSSGWVYSVLIGFDAEGSRIGENDEYTGADFTGTLYGYTGIMRFSVTGSITDASIISSVGSIFTIYAEDGLTDTSIQAGQLISRIMVGFINGLNSYYYVANYQADVSGSISAYYLGSLYYTGFTNTNNPNVLDVRSVVRKGIIKDKIADITVADISLNEGSSGLSNFAFTVTLSQVSSLPIILNYATTDGTATDGADDGEDDDYQAASGQLIIPAGWLSKTITVLVGADRKYELDENFRLQISQPTGMVAYAYLEDAQAVATVKNDDSAPKLSIDDVSHAEGDSGTTEFVFTISVNDQLTSLPVSVEYYTEDDTAIEFDNDYQFVEDDITFVPGGEKTRTVTVLVNGDLTGEPDETFLVRLSNPTNATIDSENGTGTGTIENDDAASLSIDDVSRSEGDSGTQVFTFTVTLSVESTETVTVNYATVDNTATAADNDYESVSGTLTFVPGDQTETIQVTVNGDTKVESDELFRVNLSNPVNAAITDGQGTGTITNDDAASLSINDVSKSEGNSGTQVYTFTVTLSAESTETVTVNYATVENTATEADTDYISASGTLTFVPGDLSESIMVTVNGDTKAEPDELFRVLLSNPVNATISDNAGTGTIVNDDSTSLSINDVAQAEGDSGTQVFTFTVTLSIESAETVTVDYTTTDGTATAGDNDYVSALGTLTFEPGDLTETIEVTVNGDTKVEPDELFTVDLSNAVNAVISDSQGAGTIENDDTTSLSIDDVSQAEGDSGTQVYTFMVTLSAESAETVTVDYTTTDDTATDEEGDDDYVSASGTLTFEPGDLTKTIEVTVKGDTKVEPDEIFTVDLSNAVNATISAAQGTGTITNDDSTSLSIDDVSQSEGDSGTQVFTFTVTLSAESTETVTVDYTTTDDTATVDDDDYESASGTLTFEPGDLTKTIEVTVNGDTEDEQDELFTVDLSNAVNAEIGDDQGSGTIQNDDAISLSFNNVLNNVSQLEGNSGTKIYIFTVTLSSVSTETVTVEYTTADDTATAGDDDYESTSGTLTFIPGDLTETIQVTVNGDTKVEPDELFKVVLFNAVNAEISDAEGTGTITNDDSTSLSIDDVSQEEGDSGTQVFTFTVTLSAESTETVTVNYTTADGTATTGDDDYESALGTLTFVPGDQTETIEVTVNGDVGLEPDEIFTVILSDVVNAALSDNQGNGTIENDD